MNLTGYNILLTILTTSEIHLVRDVFRNKDLHFGTIFHCKDSKNVIKIHKWFNKDQLRISSVIIDNNATLYSQLKQERGHRVGMVIKTCDNWTQTFDSQLFQNCLYSWLIFTDDISSTADTLSRYPIEVDSDVTVVHKTGSIFNFYEVYNTGFFSNGRFHVQPVGYWCSTLQLKSHKRMDFSGVVLKSAVVVTHSIVNQTFEEYMTRSKLEVDSLHKLKYFTLLMYWREMFNFSFQLVRSSSWGYLRNGSFDGMVGTLQRRETAVSGTPVFIRPDRGNICHNEAFQLVRSSSWGYLRNGSFDGMVGTLQRRETDVSGTPVFIRPDRARHIDYVSATWPSKPCFIFRHPKHPGGFITIYTRPLSDEVWWCIVALLLAASLLLCALLKLGVVRNEGGQADLSSSLALLSVWSAVCQQGMAVNRRASSVKLVLFTSFLFCLTVYQYYNAVVVSTLLRAPPVTIRTLQDLLESKLKAGVEDTLYNKDYFRRTTDPIALEMYAKKVAAAPPYNFFPPEQGMALVKRGGFAFHVDTAFAYPIIKRQFTERQNCELQEVELYPPQNMYAVMKKGSPYRKLLRYGISKMYEAGLMQRLKSVWDDTKPPCVRTPDSSIFTVTLREFSTPLLLLVVGMVTAVIVFVAELVVFKARRGGRIQFAH